MGITFTSFNIPGTIPPSKDLFSLKCRGLSETTLSTLWLMPSSPLALLELSTREHFNFRFSAVYLRKRVIC